MSAYRVTEHPGRESCRLFMVEQLADGQWVEVRGPYLSSDIAQAWIDRRQRAEADPVRAAEVVAELMDADAACALCGQVARTHGGPA